MAFSKFPRAAEGQPISAKEWNRLVDAIERSLGVGPGNPAMSVDTPGGLAWTNRLVPPETRGYLLTTQLHAFETAPGPGAIGIPFVAQGRSVDLLFDDTVGDLRWKDEAAEVVSDIHGDYFSGCAFPGDLVLTTRLVGVAEERYAIGAGRVFVGGSLLSDLTDGGTALINITANAIDTDITVHEMTGISSPVASGTFIWALWSEEHQMWVAALGPCEFTPR